MSKGRERPPPVWRSRLAQVMEDVVSRRALRPRDLAPVSSVSEPFCTFPARNDAGRLFEEKNLFYLLTPSYIFSYPRNGTKFGFFSMKNIPRNLCGRRRCPDYALCASRIILLCRVTLFVHGGAINGGCPPPAHTHRRPADATGEPPYPSPDFLSFVDETIFLYLIESIFLGLGEGEVWRPPWVGLVSLLFPPHVVRRDFRVFLSNNVPLI